MSYPDLDLARRQQATLQRLIDEHSGGADPRRLRRVLALCHELSSGADDTYCRRKILLVEECAAELLSTAEARADFLRARIREALELALSRLYSLQRARRFGQPALARGLAARLAG
jgi:hypothetical protein